MAKNPLAVILENNKLTRQNFQDWLRNLKIILDFEKRTYVLNESPPDTIGEDTDHETRETYKTWIEDNLQTHCLMMASMSNELQKTHEHMKSASEIFLHLQELYSVKTRHERYSLSRELFRARMTEGSSVHDHGLKMISLIEKLGQLDVVMDNDLYVDLILQSLPPSFDQFIMNFNMSKETVSIHELVNMLVTTETTIKRVKHVMIALSLIHI